VFVVNELVQYYGPDGKLITESLKDYTRKRIPRELAIYKHKSRSRGLEVWKGSTVKIFWTPVFTGVTTFCRCFRVEKSRILSK
jgi:hypothetical protein